MRTSVDLRPRWAVVGWKHKALLSLALAVVLDGWIYTSRSTFLDSQCRDVCPLTALHLRTAYQTLGADAPVTFISVNVNREANRVADVLATTQRWRLDEIPVWHFLTGSKAELESVWQAYHIGVEMTAESGLMHATGVYLIDQRGQQRWHVSVPFDETGASPGFTPLSDLLVLHIRELLREG